MTAKRMREQQDHFRMVELTSSNESNDYDDDRNVDEAVLDDLDAMEQIRSISTPG